MIIDLTEDVHQNGADGGVQKVERKLSRGQEKRIRTLRKTEKRIRATETPQQRMIEAEADRSEHCYDLIYSPDWLLVTFHVQ